MSLVHQCSGHESSRGRFRGVWSRCDLGELISSASGEDALIHFRHVKSDNHHRKLLNEYSSHEVHLYEADSRPGGHVNTVLFVQPGKESVDVDMYVLY